MKNWFKFLLILVSCIGVASFLLFMVGATAVFQRDLDIINTVILFLIGGPVLIITLIFSQMIVNRWKSTNINKYFGVFLV